MRRAGCLTWAGPDLADIVAAADAVPEPPEVWVPVEHPHLRDVARLWPNATLRTVGTTPPTVRRPFHVHHDVDPGLLELLTVDRPRHTIVLPWHA